MDKQTFIQKAAKLRADYAPNKQVLEHVREVDFIPVVGPTGAGKSIIIENSGIPYILSDMTRPLRKDEQDGVDIHFHDDYDKLLEEIGQGEFVQFTITPAGEFYGTRSSSYPARGSCATPIMAHIVPEFVKIGFRSVRPVYILPPNFDTWMERAKLHHSKDLDKWLIEAKESLTIALDSPDFRFLVNDRIDDSVARFKQLVANADIQDDAVLQAARNVAFQLLEELEMKIA